MSAMPTEAPSWSAVLRAREAVRASPGSTPASTTSISVRATSPRPVPVRTIPGSRVQVVIPVPASCTVTSSPPTPRATTRTTTSAPPTAAPPWREGDTGRDGRHAGDRQGDGAQRGAQRREAQGLQGQQLRRSQPPPVRSERPRRRTRRPCRGQPAPPSWWRSSAPRPDRRSRWRAPGRRSRACWRPG